MIIECINCNKKFDVNSELIPSSGRTIQCGSCDHIWFFNLSTQEPSIKTFKKTQVKRQKINFDKKNQKNANITKNYNKTKVESTKKNYELAPYKSKSTFSLSKLLSYIIVLIISFIAVIIVIDTFKSPIYKIFPSMEIIIFSLFEVLKDIELFIKDLI
tara:strand:+ start:1129 stop:1602 length:474 start_codon:yes stop_codon:yes gene_type:complete